MAFPRAALVLAALLVSVWPSASASGDQKTWARPKSTASPGAATVVPIEVAGDMTLVQATVNGAVRAMLIVDTGASATLVTPLLMTRLGQPIPPDPPRRAVSVVGGQKLDVPFVMIGVVQVGDARVEGLEVGVYDAFPEAPEIDGLLGTDSLRRFRVTIDKGGRRMTLAPLSR